MAMVHLHAHSWFSFLAGASSPLALAQRAAAMGQKALAVTDDWTLAGAVQHGYACETHGIKPIHGARVQVDDVGLVLLAIDRKTGYANLCDLLTLALTDRLNPSLQWDDLRNFSAGLFCLADFRAPLQKGHYQRAGRLACDLKAKFPQRFFIELVHHQRAGDDLLVHHLQQLAQTTGVKCAASNAVRHATKNGFALYDALVCAKNFVTVAQGHPDRPVNDAACLCDENYFHQLGLPRDSIANTYAIAGQCDVKLTTKETTPPHAPTLPTGTCGRDYLVKICQEGLKFRDLQNDATAKARLQKELDIIQHLDLDEFFLVVREVIHFARSRGIRCCGRGSAANSIIAYLLRITEVNPIKHNLLFERFLHRGRKEMPDIDVDFDSSRRDEVITWMIDTWGEEKTAMTANVITFRLRSGVREIAKVLGYPLFLIDRATKLLPSFGNVQQIHEYRPALAQVLGESPALDVLCKLTAQLHDCPRHLGLHSGGMILSRTPLREFSPIQTSANGVRQIQFSKYDVEQLGLVKLDVLGLRMLGTISECVEHIQLSEPSFDIDELTLDDEETFKLIRSGETLGLFQIESPGQWNLLSRSQPENFDDLVAQVALFRPGPLQGNMVNPFVLRRRGVTKITYPHPVLKRALKDTYGVILFQEQVLEVAHDFAGLSLEKADEFRKLMSRFRDPGEMESMREKFVRGAMETHRNTKYPVSSRIANEIFDIVAKFVGYGFCRSHAAAFARTVYHSAYLKTHYPAQYMAGVLQAEPGFYPSHTLLEETRRLGVQVLPPNLLRSDVHYSLDTALDGSLAVRIPFTRIQGMGEESAAAIVTERAAGPFQSLEDVLTRLPIIQMDEWENLARAGALDCFGQRREVLWQTRAFIRERRSAMGKRGESKDQLRLDVASVPPPPPLGYMEAYELLDWDFATMHLTSGPHPLAFHRPHLSRLDVKSVRDLRELRGGINVRVGGSVISRQRPPTAKGMCFIILEDETGRLPTAIVPHVFERFATVLRAPALLLEGKLEDSGFLAGNNYRSLMVSRIWALESIIKNAQDVPPIFGAAGYPGESPRHQTRIGGQPAANSNRLIQQT